MRGSERHSRLGKDDGVARARVGSVNLSRLSVNQFSASGRRTAANDMARLSAWRKSIILP